jgi:hypothetical protein
MSTIYKLYRRTITNPTFPGDILRARRDKEKSLKGMIELWEHETGLDFDVTVPEDAPITGCACQNCAVNRDVCGTDRPCARCVKFGLTCTPQTLLTKKKYGKAAEADEADDLEDV